MTHVSFIATVRQRFDALLRGFDRLNRRQFAAPWRTC
jgi:hypothetical protein